MNILYYDFKDISWPDAQDSDDEQKEEDELNFISIGKDSRYKKGHMIDLYVSIISDFTNKIILHTNEQ